MMIILDHTRLIKNIEDSIMIILDHTRLIKNAAKIKESS